MNERDITPSALRARYLRALGLPVLGLPVLAAANLGACATTERDFVNAPLAPPPIDAGADANASDDEAGAADAGRTATRPLREPANRENCTKAVRCKPEDDEAASVRFPEPFAKCSASFQKSDRDTQFSPRETAAARKNEEGVCCYIEWKDCRRRPRVVEGRPLRVDGELRRASVATETRWTRAAREEHESIASFARVSLELMALGAPASLVADCHRAALDEIVHARMAFALAVAEQGADGAPIGPEPLPHACAPIVPDLVRLARETLVDGCIGETAATLRATRESSASTNAREAAALARIAEDESRHAELAFRILAWALVRGGSAVARALEEELSALSAFERDAPGSPLHDAAFQVAAPVVRTMLAS
jgi:hypothetical protein